MRRLNPPQIVLLSFLITIFLGTILLSLPIATANHERLCLIDALFTATSATCVTGLIVKDTGSFFSAFGRGVILALFQAGGLGIMTLSTLFAILLGRRLTIRGNLVIQGALDQHKIEGLTTLVKYILLVTFGIESLGALLLFLRWSRLPEISTGQAIYQSIFHSISAFCNAGFSLFSKSFIGYRGDLYVNLVMTTLILLGGIGFIVLLDIPKLKFWRKDRALIFSRIGLQTKIVLIVTVCLVVAGTIFLFFSERNNALEGLSFKDSFLASYFQAVTSRTAGFNTLHIGGLAIPSLIFLVGLMFIGASPGSTGGGIKTATFGIVIATGISMMKNKDRVSIFGRTIPRHVIRKALIVFIMGLAWVLAFTLLLSIVESARPEEPKFFLRVLFEVMSAFGTVGLSTGVTPTLTSLGKALIAMTMFAGRVGPLTLALAIAIREEKLVYRYPEERVMVG